MKYYEFELNAVGLLVQVTIRESSCLRCTSTNGIGESGSEKGRISARERVSKKICFLLLSSSIVLVPLFFNRYVTLRYFNWCSPLPNIERNIIYLSLVQRGYDATFFLPKDRRYLVIVVEERNHIVDRSAFLFNTSEWDFVSWFQFTIFMWLVLTAHYIIRIRFHSAISDWLCVCGCGKVNSVCRYESIDSFTLKVTNLLFAA